MRNETIVAKIEIMEERQARAKMMGHDDVVAYYTREIEKLEREEQVRA